jgi:aquaporin Z
MKKYLTEFIGTFFLVFVIGMAVANAGNMAPVAIGCALMVMVYAGGHISGGHYNPAVTTAAVIRGVIDMKDAVIYMVAQLVGAIVAAGVIWWFTGHALVVAPGPLYSWKMALAAEMAGTFALAYVVLNVATHPKTSGNSYYGLAIGFTVLSMAYALGAVSGGAFNTAVGLGPNIVQMLTGDMSNARHVWLYIVGPIAGGAIAAYTYKFINAGE